MQTHSHRTGFAALLASSAAMGGFLFGFDTAVINGAVIAIQNHFHANAWTIGLAVSLALLGSAFGALTAGPIADRIGRTRSMQLAALFFLISAVGSGFPLTIWDFIFWRVLGGLAVGAASVLAPAYIAEVSPAQLRGRLGSLQQLAIVAGIFIALLLDFLLARAAGSAEAVLALGYEAWRWMFWTEILPAVLYGIGAMLIPESPRYLVAQGRESQAHHVLEQILPGDAHAKVLEIRHSLLAQHRPKLADVRGRLGLLPVVWLGIGLSVFQQLVGINVIFYYSSVLWRSVGFSEQHALIITAITGITNIATTFVAIALVDRFGRKPLLLTGSAGMTLALATMAILFAAAPLDQTGNPILRGSPGLIALLAANLFVFFFGFSWGPVVWVMLGEMFNNRIRATALAIAASAQWIANFAVSTTFPPMAQALGLGGSYAFYALCAALSFLLVWTKVRETKGIELEDVL